MAEFGMSGLAQVIENWQWKSADHVCTVSAVLARKIKLGSGRLHNIHVISNAVHLDRYGSSNRFAPNEVEDIRRCMCVVGFVGFIREWHDVDKLLISFAELHRSDLHLWIIGDGPARSELETMANLLGVADRVRFEGTIAEQDLPRYLEMIDIAVQPRALEYASPLKLLEYMAAGCAIIAPEQENIKELLDDGIDAILFREGNLTGAISELVDDSRLRERISCNARKKILERNLTWVGNASKILSIYYEGRPITGKRHSPAHPHIV